MAEQESQVVETPPAEPAGMDMDAAVASIAEGLRLTPEELPEEPAEPTEPTAAASAEPKEKEPEADPLVPAADEPAPDTWTPAAKAKWNETPPEVRAELRKREADISRYVGETKQKVEVATAFEKIIAPYGEIFTKYGVNPWDHTARLLNAHATLVFGRPEQKVAMFRQLAVDSGIDITKLAGDDPTAAANNELMQRLHRQEQELAQLRQGVTGVTNTVQAARAAELESSVLTFAQDEEAHPFFWEVTDQIQHFINTKAASTLEQAYELAVMANPVTKAKLLEREANKVAAKKAEEAAARAAKATKVASGNVRSSGKGRAASVPGTIDETLKEALANIHSRETH